MRERTQRRLAALASIGVLCTLMLPVKENWSKSPRDGFPLSYYPMFTKVRSKTTTLHHVVGVSRSGERHNLPGRLTCQGGMNTARRQMRRMVRDGAAESLAERAAERLVGSPLVAHLELERIEVVVSRYSIRAYFTGKTEPVDREVVASTPIGREVVR